jgi:tetratricopeptide (TPR) repeat protein
MVPSKSTENYWILQRRLLPHGQAILNCMKTETKAGISASEAWGYDRLASMFAGQDRYAEAEEMYQRALAGSEMALGPEHASTLGTVNNLGNLYRDQGRLVEAEAMFERALAGKEKALGLEHSFTLDTVNSLGILYAEQGRLAEAEAMYERALAGAEKTLGPKHTLTIHSAECLSALRMLPRESTCAEEVADSKTTVSEYSNARHPHDATRLSLPSTTSKPMSGMEERKHRPRKRDAFFKELSLRQTGPGTQ